MAYCIDCGANMPAGARFCPGCGTAAGAAAATPTLDKQPVPPPPVAPPFPRPNDAAPGDPAGAPMRGTGGIGWIVPIMVVLALALIGLLLWNQRDDDESVAPRETAQQSAPVATAGEADVAPARADTGTSVAAATARGLVSTSAGAIDLAFNVDSASASERFPAAVRVTGTIATMVTPAPNPALSLEGRTPSSEVIVNFPAGSRALLAPLRKGMTITVTCDRASGAGGTTMLYGCSL